MEKKLCVCGKEFTPAQANYFLCPDCYYDGNPPRKCAAVKMDGNPCRAWAMQGEYFCGTHFNQGYGLFTLAVRQAQDGQP